MGFLYYLYYQNCLQENRSLNSFDEVSFSWGCSVSLYDHAWNSVVMFGLVLVVATCNCCISYKIYRTVGPSLAASLETLAHRQNVASLSLLYRYCFDIFFLNWLNWFHFIILEIGLLVILIDSITFLLFDLNGLSLELTDIF